MLLKNRISFEKLANLFVAFFFIGALAVNDGYSIAGILLLLLSLTYIIKNRKNIKIEPKFIIYPFILYFTATLVSYLIYLPEKAIQVDLAGRFILAIPVAIFLVYQKINLKLIAISVALGGILAFCIAFYQVNIVQTDVRAHGYMHHIMFGQTNVLWGMLSLIGIVLKNEVATKYRLAFIIFLLFGFIGGLGASFLSGSKGAWLVIPFALLVFLIGAWRSIGIKFILIIFAILALAFTWIISTDNIVKNRINTAIIEMDEYSKNPDARYGSGGARMQMYKVGLMLFKDNVLIGIGRDAKVEEINKLPISNELKKHVSHYIRLHNDYIDIAAYYGLLVLIPFLIFLVVPAWYFGKRIFSADLQTKYLALSGFMVLVCYSMASLTDTLFQLNPGVMTFAILIPVFGSQLFVKLKERN